MSRTPVHSFDRDLTAETRRTSTPRYEPFASSHMAHDDFDTDFQHFSALGGDEEDDDPLPQIPIDAYISQVPDS